MNLEHVPAQATMVAGQHDEAARRLRGHWLLLARMLWLAIFVLTLVVFCGNLVVGNYGLVITITLVLETSVWFAVGLVLFWRKSSDRAILLFSIALVLTPLFFIPRLPGALYTYGAWWVPTDLLASLASFSLIVWYTFPDGRFVPGLTRWLTLGWVAVGFRAHSHPWCCPSLELVVVPAVCPGAHRLLWQHCARRALPLSAEVHAGPTPADQVDGLRLDHLHR